MRALRYAFDEGSASLWRGRQSAALSIATITVALVVLGGFLLMTTNLERLSVEWGRTAGMSVYLDDGVTAAERATIESALAGGDIVEGYQFVSKADALNRFKSMFADLASTVDSLAANPLPPSYDVRLQPSAAAGHQVENLGARLRQIPGVIDVRYDREWISRLLSLITIVRGFGLVLSAILTIAAALTVANVVRLALYARRDELEIMQLVGAPQAYIRGPFVMEGVLQGGVGALAAVLALGAAFIVLRGRYLVPLASAVNLSSIQFLPVELCILLVFGGMAVGCLGGLVAAWNR
jgi:cell division transport system permease protein